MTSPLRDKQESDIVTWLGLFMQPGQVTELRALHVGGQKAVSEFFDREHLPDLARRAVDYEQQGAMGVYFTPNPLRSELIRSAHYFAHDEDVVVRRWLLIDIDTTRPSSKEPATEEEKNRAWEVLCHCQELLLSAGLESPIIGDSGNGWHLNYEIEIPNDDKSRDWHKNILQWLRGECDQSKANVDISTHNASRIWKLYGTRAQKGTATAERPHRWSRIVEECVVQ